MTAKANPTKKFYYSPKKKFLSLFAPNSSVDFPLQELQQKLRTIVCSPRVAKMSLFNSKQVLKQTLQIAKILKIKEAIMKAKSPSCGCGQIYDGSFTKKLIVGDGVTTKLLKKNGIKVVTENEI